MGREQWAWPVCLAYRVNSLKGNKDNRWRQGFMSPQMLMLNVKLPGAWPAFPFVSCDLAPGTLPLLMTLTRKSPWAVSLKCLCFIFPLMNWQEKEVLLYHKGGMQKSPRISRGLLYHTGPCRTAQGYQVPRGSESSAPLISRRLLNTKLQTPALVHTPDHLETFIIVVPHAGGEMHKLTPRLRFLTDSGQKNKDSLYQQRKKWSKLQRQRDR